MRLDIGPLRIIDGLEPVDRELLNLIHHLATAVVALAGIALGVLVRADGTHRAEHVLGYVILGSYEFQAVLLPVGLLLDQLDDLDVLLHKGILVVLCDCGLCCGEPCDRHAER